MSEAEPEPDSDEVKDAPAGPGTDLNADVEPDEQDESEPPESPDELPAIEDGERADLSAVADDIQAETDEDLSEPEDQGDESDETEETDSAESEASESTGGEGTFGDAYVSALSLGVSAAVEARGGEADVEKYERRAEQVDLGKNFDRMMDQRGFDEMTPEQAVVTSTAMFVFTALAEDTDVLTEVMK